MIYTKHCRSTWVLSILSNVRSSLIMNHLHRVKFDKGKLKPETNSSNKAMCKQSYFSSAEHMTVCVFVNFNQLTNYWA